MILNLTQHAATPEQLDQGLVDYTNRESLKALLTIPERALTNFNWILEDILDNKVKNLVTIAETYQAEAVDTIPDDVRGMRRLNTIRDALRLRVLVGGAPILMERLIPALKREGCIPVHALSARVVEEVPQSDGTVKKVSTFKHIRFMHAL